MSVAIAEWRQWVKDAARGNPWRYRPARADVEIAPLVSPLRLDVMIRREFFEFYVRHRVLCSSDFEAFAAAARRHAYFVWFERVMCPRWQPHVLSDETLFAAAWRTRLRAAAALFVSFERHGFDARFPITLYEGSTVLPTPTGKRVSRTLYAGDGNHRLALLMLAGQSVLLPSQYRVKRFRTLVPSDTTAGLLGPLGLDEERYVAFLRAGYPAIPVRAGDGMVEVAGGTLEPEIRELLRVDLPQLEGVRT